MWKVSSHARLSPDEKLAVSGVILAGGASRRMGSDKAQLRLGGRTLIDRVVGTLRELCDEVIIVSNQTELYSRLGVHVISDAIPGTGSLGGIYSGLLAARNDRALVVACDMPFLSPTLLRHLASASIDCDVVIPSAPKLGKPLATKSERPTAKDADLHPLHALYSKRCLGPIEACLQAGDLRMIGFHDGVRVCIVPKTEVEQLDPGLLSTFNVNTPEDLKLAEHLTSESGRAGSGEGLRLDQR